MNLATKTICGVALSAAVLGAVAPLAHAGSSDDAAEASAFLASGTTLPQAAAMAESALGGNAMSVSWEHRDTGEAVFVVELAHQDGTVNSVLVDPTSHAVTAMADDEGGLDDSDQGNCAEDDD